VHAEIAEWITGVAIPRRQRATFVRGYSATQDMTDTMLPERASRDRVERALDLWIVEQRVVDARGEALGVRELADLARVGFISAIGFSTRNMNSRAPSAADRDLRGAADGGVSTWMTFATGGDQRVEIAMCRRAYHFSALACARAASRSVMPTSSTPGIALTAAT